MTTGGAAAVRGAHRHPMAALVVANLVYAGAFPASEVALRELGPMTLAGFRFLVAALLLAPVALPALRRITLAQTLRLLSIAALGLWLQMVLIYYGIDQANGAIAAIIVGLEPVMIALWAALLLHERFGGRRAAGLTVGLAGSLLVAGVGLQGGAGPGGVALLLGTGLSFSWYTVSSKRHLTRHGALELTALISLLGAVVSVLPMIVDVTVLDGWRDPGALTWATVIYLGAGNSVIGYVLWNRALAGLPAAAVGASLYAQPLLGAGLSWALLRDPLPPTFLPGAALVLLGVWIATRPAGAQRTMP
ncbi:MAG TPA: DMT family transporter [Gaiellales bacterium]|nr:DMT family transporter [Gaiellales bacterium]